MARHGENLDDWKTPKEDTSSSGVADTLFLESKRLTQERRYKEALTLITIAIEHDDSNFEYFYRKGLILENLNRFSESLEAYDRAINLNDDDGILEGKSRMLYKWANSLNDKDRALELINEAILILPESSRERYFEKFWYLKGSILDCLGDPISSRKCYLIAEGMTEEVNKLDREVDFLKNSKETLINITGTRFYEGMEPFKKGLIVNLVREPENEHDPDAIRVEMAGVTLGYVANNDYTLIENVKSASEIKDKKIGRAEIVMVYLDEYVIAKLVE